MTLSNPPNRQYSRRASEAYAHDSSLQATDSLPVVNEMTHDPNRNVFIRGILGAAAIFAGGCDRDCARSLASAVLRVGDLKLLKCWAAYRYRAVGSELWGDTAELCWISIKCTLGLSSLKHLPDDQAWPFLTAYMKSSWSSSSYKRFDVVCDL
jgi:hypothetical protein